MLQEVQVAETGNSFVGVAEDTPTDPDLTTGKKDVFLVDVRTFKLRNDFCFLRVYINKTWVQKKAFSFFDVCMQDAQWSELSTIILLLSRCIL